MLVDPAGARTKTHPLILTTVLPLLELDLRTRSGTIATVQRHLG